MVVPYGNKKSKTNQPELKRAEKSWKENIVISKPSENKVTDRSRKVHEGQNWQSSILRPYKISTKLWQCIITGLKGNKCDRDKRNVNVTY